MGALEILLDAKKTPQMKKARDRLKQGMNPEPLNL